MANQLTSLIRPFSTVKSLQSAPQPILDDLLSREQRLESQLTGRAVSGSRLQPLLVTLVIVGCTSGALLAHVVSSFDLTTHSLRYTVHGFIHRVFTTAPGEGLILVAVIPWIVGTLLLWTACRR